MALGHLSVCWQRDQVALGWWDLVPVQFRREVLCWLCVISDNELQRKQRAPTLLSQYLCRNPVQICRPPGSDILCLPLHSGGRRKRCKSDYTSDRQITLIRIHCTGVCYPSQRMFIFMNTMVKLATLSIYIAPEFHPSLQYVHSLAPMQSYTTLHLSWNMQTYS
jgi:hypothetical protein